MAICICVVPVAPRAEKFNIVSNDHGCTLKCNFSVFVRKYPFWANWSKNQNCQIKLKFGTQTNSNMENSMVVFTFSGLNQKHFFWVNLVQKIKIVSLSWILVPRLIRICRIQLRCSLFLYQTMNTFFEELWSSKSKLSV